MMQEKAHYPDPNVYYAERAKGMPLFEFGDRSQVSGGRGTPQPYQFCFSAVAALEWLCDFTSVVGRDEAAEMSAHFVRFGLIALVHDKRKGNDSAIIFTVRGTPAQNVAVSVVFPTPTRTPTLTNIACQAQGEFRCTSKGGLSNHG